MSLTIASTTSSQAQLDHASSEEWRDSPPPQPEEKQTPTNADPLEKVDQKTFNEIRNEEENSKRLRHKGAGELKRIGQLTREKYQLLERLAQHESLDSLNLTPTERRRLEEKGLGKALVNSNANGSKGATPAPQAAESTPAKPAAQPNVKQTNATPENVKDKSERIGKIAGELRNAGNFEEVRNFLVKNPAVTRDLEDGRITVPQVLAHVQQQAPRPQADPETVQQMEKFNGHMQRARKAFAENPNAQKLLADAMASGIDIATTVHMAVIEQGENSDQVLLHLLGNHKLRQELNNLPPAAAMARVTRIAAQLEAKASRPKVQPPAPIEPVTNASSRGNLSLEDMPIRDFIRERNRQERSRGRR